MTTLDENGEAVAAIRMTCTEVAQHRIQLESVAKSDEDVVEVAGREEEDVEEPATVDLNPHW